MRIIIFSLEIIMIKKKSKSRMLITTFSPEIHVIKKKILNVDHNIFLLKYM